MTDVGWIDETEDSKLDLYDPTGISYDFPKTGAIPSVKINEPYLMEISNSSLDTPWSITSELITPKPTVEEELSKIHEELACVNKTLNEMQHESVKKDDIIEQQRKENKKLKAKLKKEKTKSNNNQMQAEVDGLQLDMNKVKDILDFKRYINGL